MNWQTIYQAATEMEAKCVTQGKSAAVAELGERHPDIYVTSLLEAYLLCT